MFGFGPLGQYALGIGGDLERLRLYFTVRAATVPARTTLAVATPAARTDLTVYPVQTQG